MEMYIGHNDRVDVPTQMILPTDQDDPRHMSSSFGIVEIGLVTGCWATLSLGPDLWHILVLNNC